MHITIATPTSTKRLSIPFNSMTGGQFIAPAHEPSVKTLTRWLEASQQIDIPDRLPAFFVWR